MKLGSNRKIAVDVTVFGMGRGAGNVGTEQIMEYLNKKCDATYEISKILEIYNKYLKEIYNRDYWGYSAKYYLTAQKNINSAYAWYLSYKGISNILEMDAVLDLIPEEIRYSLNKAAADKAILMYREYVS
jgi:4-hydroxy 2-oxovalerate aldolase